MLQVCAANGKQIAFGLLGPLFLQRRIHFYFVIHRNEPLFWSIDLYVVKSPMYIFPPKAPIPVTTINGRELHIGTLYHRFDCLYRRRWWRVNGFGYTGLCSFCHRSGNVMSSSAESIFAHVYDINICSERTTVWAVLLDVKQTWTASQRLTVKTREQSS